jgi:acetyl-CoA synthetase
MSERFAFVPSPDLVAKSNVKRFMEKHGIEDYSALIRRSTEEIEWFWDAIVKELKIEFFKPYNRVLDLSQGIAWAKWFVGGEINIAYNCLDRHICSVRRAKPALIWEGEDEAVRRLTYQELADGTNRLANALKRLGVTPGDRVGVFLPMIPETAMALLACAKIGAIFTPVFSGFGPEAVAARLNDGLVKVLLTADGFLRKGHPISMKETADQAVARSPSVERVIVFRRLGSKIPWEKNRDLDWAELVVRESAECPCESLDSEAPFMVIYTSGTTGKPKGAVHVHGGFLVKIAQEVAHQTDLHDDDILFWFTDMGWIMGPWGVVGGLALGGTLFFYEGAPDYPQSDRLWALIERHKITTLGLSPTLVRALMRYGDGPLKKHDLSSLRILGSTGEPWDPTSWRWCLERVGGGRCPIINLSGGTEIGACFLSALPITPLKPCALVGPALGMAVDVVDSQGRPVRGEVGELICRKPWPAMTRGLWQDPQRYLKTYWSRWPDVWVHGDWASIDQEGYWFLHGRSDDTLKIAGKRVGPAEFEAVLVSHPAVSEAAAVGVPHELKGETVWCYVVLKPGNEPSEALKTDLRRLVAERLGRPFAPDKIGFVTQLPKTRNAKILRRAVRAAALGQEPGDLSSLENPQALEEIKKAT